MRWNVLINGLVIFSCIGNCKAEPQQLPDAKDAKLVMVNRFSCVTAGKRAEFQFQDFRSDRTKPVGWAFKKSQRTLATGTAISRRTDSGKYFVTINVEMPSVATGVVLPVDLVVSFSGDDATERVKLPLFLYSADPVFEPNNKIGSANIGVFDPPGETARKFKQFKVPFQKLADLASIGRFENGLIVVGEGLDLTKQTGLLEVLSRAAIRGNQVLLLAPESGAINFDLNALPCRQLQLGRADRISRFDERLDYDYWNGVAVSKATFSVTQSNETLALTSGESINGWSWVECSCGRALEGNFDKRSEATFVICGLRIIKHWDDGPVPRYLLLNLINQLTSRGNQK